MHIPVNKTSQYKTGVTKSKGLWALNALLVPWVLQALVLACGYCSVKDAQLSGRKLTSIRDLLMRQYQQVGLADLSVTSLSPLCHLSATSLPPLCHLSVTSLSPLCHLSATSLSPLCHLSVTSVTIPALYCKALFLFSTFQTQDRHHLLHVKTRYTIKHD